MAPSGHSKTAGDSKAGKPKDEPERNLARAGCSGSHGFGQHGFRGAAAAPKPVTGLPAVTTPSNAHPAKLEKPSVNKAAVKCFSCGQMGHYAADPACLKFGQRGANGPKMFAQRVVDDTSDHEAGDPKNTANGHEDPADQMDYEAERLMNEAPYPDEDKYPCSEPGYGGSQYESEDEGARMPDEDYEFSNSVLFGTMRIEVLHIAGAKDSERFNSMAIARDKGLRHAWLYDAKVRRATNEGDQP